MGYLILVIKIRFLEFILILFTISGCTRIPVSTPSEVFQPSDTFIPLTATSYPTESIFTPTLTISPTQTPVVTPSPSAIPSCITLIFEEYAQVEIISPLGIRVLIDVYDPGLLSEPASEEDILLTTHTHWDHLNGDFQGSFPGKQLFTQAGIIEMGDAKIQGIPSAHNAGDGLIPEGGTNYIYLVDIGGLRIVHFGDIGQDALTVEQLDVLGRVDVAITQLANPYSNMSAVNQKGITLMQQVSPRLIIPTHGNLDSAKVAVARWQGLYSETSGIELCATDLIDQTQVLFLGQSAIQFDERLNLSVVDW